VIDVRVYRWLTPILLTDFNDCSKFRIQLGSGRFLRCKLLEWVAVHIRAFSKHFGPTQNRIFALWDGR